jgi:hypothetical protein
MRLHSLAEFGQLNGRYGDAEQGSQPDTGGFLKVKPVNR